MKQASSIDNSYKLKIEADSIIEETGIIDLIKKYSDKWTFVGSYGYATMVWRDIDISFHLEKSQLDDFFSLGSEIAKINGVYGMKFNNEYNRIPKKPDGYYWGIELYNKSCETNWKIDIKGLPIERYKSELAFFNDTLAKIDDNKRQLIINVKSKLIYKDEKGGRYRTPYGSGYHICNLVANMNYLSETEVMNELHNLKIV